MRTKMIPSDLLMNALTYSNMLVLMSLGLTFSYITLKVPNFAQGDFIAIGAYIAYTSYIFWNLHPYLSIPSAFLISGGISLLMFLFIFSPLSKKGFKVTDLMIAYFAAEMIIRSALLIYTDYMQRTFSKYFSNILIPLNQVRVGDYSIPFPLLISSILTITILFSFLIVLNYTKLGISLRAAIQNPELAKTYGVNVERVYAISWFLAGGITGMTGPVIVTFFPTDPNIGWTFLVRIFAASIVGGIDSLLGAVIGGFFVGISEVTGIYVLSQPPIGLQPVYRVAIPFILMIIALLFMPRGIVSSIDRAIIRLREKK
ncbi:MAG: branched-chain amino acid ABC transporter permease [Fervidicoccaceae archaeon]